MLGLVSSIVLVLLDSVHISIVILPALIRSNHCGVCAVSGRPVEDVRLLEYLRVEGAL